jgi:hypothetical protein
VASISLNVLSLQHEVHYSCDLVCHRNTDPFERRKPRSQNDPMVSLRKSIAGVNKPGLNEKARNRTFASSLRKNMLKFVKPVLKGVDDGENTGDRLGRVLEFRVFRYSVLHGDRFSHVVENRGRPL